MPDNLMTMYSMLLLCWNYTNQHMKSNTCSRQSKFQNECWTVFYDQEQDGLFLYSKTSEQLISALKRLMTGHFLPATRGSVRIRKLIQIDGRNKVAADKLPSALFSCRRNTGLPGRAQYGADSRFLCSIFLL